TPKPNNVSGTVSTTYEYDALNRRIKVTDPLNGITNTKYDLSGNILEIEDALNRKTTYAYDPANRTVTTTTSGLADKRSSPTTNADASNNKHSKVSIVVTIELPLTHTTILLTSPRSPDRKESPTSSSVTVGVTLSRLAKQLPSSTQLPH
ncbi:MAG: RHS repeat protein, partial [Chamaesiphon sp. CSU_1_12]|nr:RHS repeat protein [Chamaesiphon sp. CSU_1_12]